MKTDARRRKEKKKPHKRANVQAIASQARRKEKKSGSDGRQKNPPRTWKKGPQSGKGGVRDSDVKRTERKWKKAMGRGMSRGRSEATERLKGIKNLNRKNKD